MIWSIEANIFLKGFKIIVQISWYNFDSFFQFFQIFYMKFLIYFCRQFKKDFTEVLENSKLFFIKFIVGKDHMDCLLDRLSINNFTFFQQINIKFEFLHSQRTFPCLEEGYRKHERHVAEASFISPHKRFILA